jgi:hypothetical protein
MMRTASWIRAFAYVFLITQSAWAFADGEIPACKAYNRDLPINNDQVLHWKRTTKNQFQERGHVKGPVVDTFTDKNRHEHFEIKLGKKDDDTLEVIYNQEFGALPTIQLGMEVEACGDYITSTAQAGPYPPSPSGAIIHWVHFSPKPARHPHGYLVIDGKLYGMETDKAGPKPPRKPKPGHPYEIDALGEDGDDSYFHGDILNYLESISVFGVINGEDSEL